MPARLEAIIGLEVHAQMNTRSKMFCACDNDAWGKDPNTTVCPICMGHPGTLPVPNAEAVAKAVRASLAIGCTVQEDCHFDRKHYFYPDLPAGFQISQYDFPLAKGGAVAYDVLDASGRNTGAKTCHITRLHMENDAGKLTHRSTGLTAGSGTATLCDFNRAGTPLMEIVTEPDLRSAQEAVAFAQELRRILIAVGASDADMFKGMMRFDASISLRESGTETLNPRSEIKNLNSFKALEKALQYEEKRLREEWESSGGPLKFNITVGWLDDEGRTRLLREKEEAQDYRYFPEPDIPPMHFEKDEIKKIQLALPSLPRERRSTYVAMGLTEAQALQLTDDSTLSNYFEVVSHELGDAKKASGIVLTQMLGFLKTENKSIVDAPPLNEMIELALCIKAGRITGNAAKDVLEKMVKTGKGATRIMDEEGMEQISDEGALAAIVDKAIAANEKSVADYKSGKTVALGSIVGWIMKETKGQADPKVVNEMLRKKIG